MEHGHLISIADLLKDILEDRNSFLENNYKLNK